MRRVEEWYDTDEETAARSVSHDRIEVDRGKARGRICRISSGVEGRGGGGGETYDEAVADVRSAIHFHIETFGPAVLDSEEPVLEAFVAEATVG